MSTKNTRIVGAVGIINRLKLYTNTATDKEMITSTDIKRSTMDKWRKADSIPRRTVKKIADSLGIRFEWLAHGDGLPTVEIRKPLFGGHDHVNEPANDYQSGSQRICALYDLLSPEAKEQVRQQIISLLKSEID